MATGQILKLLSRRRAVLFRLPSIFVPFIVIAIVWALHDQVFAIPHFQRIDNSAAHSSAIKRKTDLNNCLNTCALNSSCNGGCTDAGFCFLNIEQKTYVLNVSTSDYYIRVNIAGSKAQCSAAQAPKAQCSAGWSLQPPKSKTVEQACFGVSNEQKCSSSAQLQISPSQSCNAAKTWCEERNAKLATIDSSAQNIFVSLAIQSLRKVTAASYFCIGFIANNSPNTQKGVFQKNSFHWIDGTKWNYSAFGTNQPSQTIGANCGVMYVGNGGTGFTWYNRPCGTQQTGAICQTLPNFIYNA